MIMTTFESTAKTINAPRKPVHGFLSDIGNLEKLVPEGRVRNLEVHQDVCRFTVDGIGEIGIRRLPSREEGVIRFESEGSQPFSFDLAIELDETPGNNTVLRLVLSAKLNAMMRMMARKPIQEGVEIIASMLSEELNNKQLQGG
ncbi:MAG: hypothetical protein EA408_09180 [Marinilabiliales bacterium]|nr:MAG: hypothetical protein EA408_09180 [Marinilabiliales bacterium]